MEIDEKIIVNYSNYVMIDSTIHKLPSTVDGYSMVRSLT